MAGPAPSPHEPSRYIHLASCDSTNAEAMRLAAHGERGPVWVLSDVQTSGRGRSGRLWSSDLGNFFGSFLNVLPGNPPRAYQISLVTGVAVAEAIHALVPHTAGLDLRLKWPNDILAGRSKIGGILVESTQVADGGLAVVIGVGLNLVSHPVDTAQPADHLASFGAAPDAKAVLSELDHQVGRWLDIWSGGQGFAEIREAWLRHSGSLGERLRVNSGAGPVEGTYQGVDQDGALILTGDDGNQRIYSYGDVTLVG
jgi:BirA family transcriptional regulator, biotin operon repressor / biotin---[acetyl-CoA-carboxylase] ligase